ncbi:MAG: YdcF family protein [Candidatus Ancillula sp.]|nr:YdcF family protein [Candidatus Ancillula sp.]
MKFIKFIVKLVVFRILVTLFLVVSLLSGACFAWVKLSTASRITSVDTVSNATVGIVLGAGINPNGTPSSVLKNRLDMGKELLDKKKVDGLLLSGDGSSLNHNEPQIMMNYLTKQGVDPKLLKLDFAGLSTRDSCHRAANNFSIKNAVVITDDYHVPRAIFLCSGFGIDTQGVEVHTNFNLWYTVREYAADTKAVLDYLMDKF